MNELKMEPNITIDDTESVLNNLCMLTGRKITSFEKIEEFIQSEVFTKIYLGEKMNQKKEEEADIRYLWLDTGLENQDKKPIFLSLLPSGDEYYGHYVGTANVLAKKIKDFYPHNLRAINQNQSSFSKKYESKIVKRAIPHITEEFEVNQERIEESSNNEKENSSMMTALKSVGIMKSEAACTLEEEDELQESVPVTRMIPWIQDLYNELLINTWKSPNGLDRYIKIIGNRIKCLIEAKRTEYYMMNNIKSVVINSALIDKFGTDILILYKYNMTETCYKAYSVVTTKMDLIRDSFPMEEIKKNLKPIDFYDSDTILRASVDDFDINYKSLTHIIEERIERFPADYQQLKSDVIASKIKSALELGLKLQARDYNYAKPVYSTKQTGISWYMPLHIHKSLSEPPELVMVIKKDQNFYQVKTILSYDDNIKDRITAVNLYSTSW